MAIVSWLSLCFSTFCAVNIVLSRLCVKLKIVQLKKSVLRPLHSVPFCLFCSCFWTQECVLCVGPLEVHRTESGGPNYMGLQSSQLVVLTTRVFLHIKKSISHVWCPYVSIYKSSTVYLDIYMVYTPTQKREFCSRNHIIYPRRDSTWIQSAYKHNLFSTARVTYNGQQRRYQRGLQSGLPHEFIIEGSKNHRECFMAKSALCYPASDLLCECFMSCLIYRSVIIFCHKHAGPNALFTLNQREYFRFFFLCQARWSIHINCVNCEAAKRWLRILTEPIRKSNKHQLPWQKRITSMLFN